MEETKEIKDDNLKVKKHIRGLELFQNWGLYPSKENQLIFLIADFSIKELFFVIPKDVRDRMLRGEISYSFEEYIENYNFDLNNYIISNYKKQYIVYEKFYYAYEDTGNNILIIEDAGSFEGDNEIFVYGFYEPSIIPKNSSYHFLTELNNKVVGFFKKMNSKD